MVASYVASTLLEWHTEHHGHDLPHDVSCLRLDGPRRLEVPAAFRLCRSPDPCELACGSDSRAKLPDGRPAFAKTWRIENWSGKQGFGPAAYARSLRQIRPVHVLLVPSFLQVSEQLGLEGMPLHEADLALEPQNHATCCEFSPCEARGFLPVSRFHGLGRVLIFRLEGLLGGLNTRCQVEPRPPSCRRGFTAH